MEHDVSRSLFAFLPAAFRISFAVTEITLTLAFGFLLFFGATRGHRIPWSSVENLLVAKRLLSAGYASLVFEGDLTSSKDADLPCSGWASLIPRNLRVLQGTRSEPASGRLWMFSARWQRMTIHSCGIRPCSGLCSPFRDVHVGSVSDSKGFVEPMFGT